MKNFNKVALAFALTVPMGSSVVQAEGVGDKQQDNQTEYEYITSTGQSVGNIATLFIAREMSDSLSQADYPYYQNIYEPASSTAKAVRIGNQVQITELPPPPPEPLYIPNFHNWVALAECESGGDWHINTGNGFDGGLQFAPSSWRAARGLEFSQRAYLATPEQQMLIAENLLIMQGWGAWPACARELGLR